MPSVHCLAPGAAFHTKARSNLFKPSARLIRSRRQQGTER